MSLNGKGINETNELDCLRELVVQGGDDGSATPAGTNNIGNVGARQYSASSNATVGTADGTVATLAAGQVLQLQNLDNDELYVKLGAGASTSSFTFIIPACTAANDGTVPPYLIDNWIGVVSVKAEADTSPRYLATVLS